MEDLTLHNCALTVHWEYKTSCISVVESKTVTTRIKHVNITVCFLQDQFDNGISVTKYENSSVML